MLKTLLDLMILEERAGGRALPPFARLIKGTPVREEQRCINMQIIELTTARRERIGRDCPTIYRHLAVAILYVT